MLVKDWMTTNVHTVTPKNSFAEALRLMKEKKIKHLPVVEGKKVVGMVSDRDIKQFGPSKATSLDIYELNYLLDKTLIKDVMVSPVLTVPAETPVEEAAMTLFDKNIGCLPVIENNELVGIITDRDMYRVLVEISGVRHGGVRISLAIEDKPGSIKDVADVVRKYGFRLQSILSTNEKSAPGQRYVVIRTRGEGDAQGLKKEVQQQFKMVRILTS